MFTPLKAVPEPPEYLGPMAARTWHHYAPELVDTGVIAKTDLHILAVFCDAWERWERCTADVREHGSILETGGRPSRNPAGRCADDAWKVVRECSALLGLDPQSRSRLEVRGAVPEAENPFLALTRKYPVQPQ